MKRNWRRRRKMRSSWATSFAAWARGHRAGCLPGAVQPSVAPDAMLFVATPALPPQKLKFILVFSELNRGRRVKAHVVLASVGQRLARAKGVGDAECAPTASALKSDESVRAQRVLCVNSFLCCHAAADLETRGGGGMDLGV